MKKLKLQMQLSVNGFVCGPNGEMDWMTWNWDDELKKYVNDLTDTIDTILLGRKTAEGFIPYWANAVKNKEDENHAFAPKMVDAPKVVFTKTLRESPWGNTTLAKDDIVKDVTKLKEQPGKDMIAYGGAGFVSELIRHDLIDELHLFINPAAIPEGMAIFKERKNLELVKATPFSCGIVVLQYKLREEK
jgi:dihydrofolate reductase